MLTINVHRVLLGAHAGGIGFEVNWFVIDDHGEAVQISSDSAHSAYLLYI